MHAEEGARPARDGTLYQHRVDVEGRWLDVDEGRDRTAVADAVGGRDEGVAGRDHLVSRLHADGEQGHVQGRGAARYGAGVPGADNFGELALEGGDLRPLGDPAGQDRPTGRLGLALIHPGAGDRDHSRRIGHGRPPPAVTQLRTTSRSSNSSGDWPRPTYQSRNLL